MSNYRIVTDDEYLAHHGVQGQHWGVQNGPPYPLDRSISTGSRLKDTSGTKKKKNVLNKDLKDVANNYKIKKIKKQQQEEARKLKVEKAKTKLLETRQKVKEEQKKNGSDSETKNLSKADYDGDTVVTIDDKNKVVYPGKPPQQQNQQQNQQVKREPTTAEKYGHLSSEAVKDILKTKASDLTNDELSYLNNRLMALNNARNFTKDPTFIDRLDKAKTVADKIVSGAQTATNLYNLGNKVYKKLSDKKPSGSDKSYEDFVKGLENMNMDELNKAFNKISKLKEEKKKK